MSKLFIAVFMLAACINTSHALELKNPRPEDGAPALESLPMNDTRGSSEGVFITGPYTPPSGRYVGSAMLTFTTTKGLMISGTPYYAGTTIMELEYSGGNGVRMWRLTAPNPASTYPNGWLNAAGFQFAYWDIIKASPLAVAGVNDTLTVVSGGLFDTNGDLLEVPSINSNTTCIFDMWPNDGIPAEYVYGNNLLPYGQAPVTGNFNIFFRITAPQSGINGYAGRVFYDPTYVEPLVTLWDEAEGTGPDVLCLWNGTCNGSTACGAKYQEFMSRPDTTGSFDFIFGTLCDRASIKQYGDAFLIPFHFKPGTPPGYTTTLSFTTLGMWDFWTVGARKPINLSSASVAMSSYSTGGGGGGCDPCIDPSIALLKGKPVEWYDVAGRKLSGKPDSKGIYFIRSVGHPESKKVVIK